MQETRISTKHTAVTDENDPSVHLNKFKRKPDLSQKLIKLDQNYQKLGFDDKRAAVAKPQLQILGVNYPCQPY